VSAQVARNVLKPSEKKDVKSLAKTKVLPEKRPTSAVPKNKPVGTVRPMIAGKTKSTQQGSLAPKPTAASASVARKGQQTGTAANVNFKPKYRNVPSKIDTGLKRKAQQSNGQRPAKRAKMDVHTPKTNNRFRELDRNTPVRKEIGMKWVLLLFFEYIRLYQNNMTLFCT
jgi:hypothetical protein